MMRTAPLFGIGGLAVLLTASLLTLVSSATDLPGAQDTARILEAIDKSQGSRTSEDASAALSLNADGDRAYKQHKYSAAFTAYANSYPNSPNAYAYIMAGDAHWRAIVAYHDRIHPQRTETQACSLDNSHFTHDLALDLAQHYEVGLALAQRESDPNPAHAGVYARARESAVCLKAMVRQYDAKPAAACVDLAMLRSCLGVPLIK